MIIKSGLTPQKILYLYGGLSVLSFLPFLISEFVLSEYYVSECMGMGIKSGYGEFPLGAWILIDAILKTVALAKVLFGILWSSESTRKEENVSYLGNWLTVYYLFELGWIITASVIFWGYPQNFPQLT